MSAQSTSTEKPHYVAVGIWLLAASWCVGFYHAFDWLVFDSTKVKHEMLLVYATFGTLGLWVVQTLLMGRAPYFASDRAENTFWDFVAQIYLTGLVVTFLNFLAQYSIQIGLLGPTQIELTPETLDAIGRLAQ